MMRLKKRFHCKDNGGRSKSIFLFLFCYAFLAFVFFTAPLHGSETPAAREVGVSFWREVVSFDPAYATDLEELILHDALSEGLVDIDHKGRIAGKQAQSWTVDEDGLRYEFKLRDDISWTDGQPVIADDFVLAFRRLVDPALGGKQRPNYLLNEIENAAAIMEGKADVSTLGVLAPDPRTVVFKLVGPASYFLEILDYPALVPVPSHLIKLHGESWSDPARIVNNGAYKIQEVSDDGSIIVKIRDAKAHPEAPGVVKYHVLKDLNDAVYRVLRGEIDIAWDINQRNVDWMKSMMGIRQMSDVMPMTVYSVFNTRRDKLKDKRVRQALDLAIDRQGLANASYAPVAHSFAVPKMLAGVYSGLAGGQGEPSYEDRLKRAKALLTEAGFDSKNPLELKVLSVRRKSLETAAMALRSMFSQIGVKVDIEFVEMEDFSPRLAAKDYEVSVSFWIADYNDAMSFYGILQKNATKNHSAFSSPQYDDLIEQALRERDHDKRLQLYLQLENIIREEVPIVPLTHSTYNIITSPNVEDIPFDPLKIFHILKVRYRKQP